MPAQRKFILLILFWIITSILVTSFLLLKEINNLKSQNINKTIENLQLTAQNRFILSEQDASLQELGNFLKQETGSDIVLWQPGNQPVSTLPPLSQNKLVVKSNSFIDSEADFKLKLKDPLYQIYFKYDAANKIYIGIALQNPTALIAKNPTIYLELMLYSFLIILAAGLTIFLFSRPIIRSVRQLNKSLQLAEAGKLEEISQSAGHDEFSDLAFHFNRYASNLSSLLEVQQNKESELSRQLKESHGKLIKLTENLERVVERRTSELREKDKQLLQTGKLAGLGQMSTGIAHEINQPLNVIKLIVTGLMRMYSRKKTLDVEMVVKELNTINQQVMRVQKIISHMKSFARKRSNITFEQIDINKSIHDALLMVGQQLSVHEIKLDLQLDEQISPIFGDAIQIEQIFINLLNNARDAIELKESLLLKKGHASFDKVISVKSYQKNKIVYFEVSDNGSGMTEEIQEQIFEPFFSTKDQKGTGLGMSITFNLIKNMNGEIDIKSELAKGSTFIIRFPIAEEQNSENNTDPDSAEN